jgi:hypothetical protein
MHWITEIFLYLSRSWLAVTAILAVGLALRLSNLRSIAAKIAFSLLATLVITPVPALVVPGHMANAVFPYYFEPFTLLAFLGWPYTRLAAVITFAVVFAASFFIIGARPNNSSKPTPLRGAA